MVPLESVQIKLQSFELTGSLSCPKVIDGVAGSIPNKSAWVVSEEQNSNK